MSTEVFLFTDVEGSTRRRAEDPSAMRQALATHDRLVRAALVAAGGQVFKHTGDGFVARFPSASTALAGASM